MSLWSSVGFKKMYLVSYLLLIGGLCWWKGCSWWWWWWCWWGICWLISTFSLRWLASVTALSVASLGKVPVVESSFSSWTVVGLSGGSFFLFWKYLKMKNKYLSTPKSAYQPCNCCHQNLSLITCVVLLQAEYKGQKIIWVGVRRCHYVWLMMTTDNWRVEAQL